jgi:hypothetical protein
MCATWRGPLRDENGLPFGRRAQGWLRRQIRSWLETAEGADEEKVAELLDWYMETPLRYVNWKDCDEYHGRGFSMGAWTVDWPTVREDFDLGRTRLAEREAQARDYALGIRTLDDWLRADIAGTLTHPGAIGGMLFVADSLRYRGRTLRRMAPCDACRKVFKLDRRNARNCPDCRVRLRAEREARAGKGAKPTDT